MEYTYLKAVHIVAVISWMAALLYIPRLFIYHTEAKQNENAENFKKLDQYFQTMQRRLMRGIALPAMLMSIALGIWMTTQSEVMKESWFHWKMLFLIGLFAYHGKCSSIRKKLSRGDFRHSSKFLRILNEVATVLMIAIVFPAVTKEKISALWGVLGFAAIVLLIVLLLGLKSKQKPKA